MMQTNILTPEMVLEELQFATRHNFAYVKKDCQYVLSPDEIPEICTKTNLLGEIKAEVKTEAPDKFEVYRVMRFSTLSGEQVAEYITFPLVSSEDDFNYDPQF